MTSYFFVRCYTTPSRKDVSSTFKTLRKNVISLRVFSKISRGSSDGQRKQFGAQTIDKLFSSIFDLDTFSGIINA